MSRHLLNSSDVFVKGFAVDCPKYLFIKRNEYHIACLLSIQSFISIIGLNGKKDNLEIFSFSYYLFCTEGNNIVKHRQKGNEYSLTLIYLQPDVVKKVAPSVL